MSELWKEFWRGSHDVSIIEYKNKANMKVAVNNINIKIRQLFS